MIQRSRTELSIEQQIGKVKAKMVNLAERSNSACVKVMREYAEKVKLRAARYAPEETGALGDPSKWKVEEKKNGINRRLTFTVKLKPNVRRNFRGKSIPISRYAKYMHDGDYTIQGFKKVKGSKDKKGKEINSRAKANREHLSKYPNNSGTYVGRLFLTRAVNQYRLKTLEMLRKAVAKELK